MPSILVNDDGTGSGSFVTDRFEVGDVLGMAVVVDVRPDNFANIPVGTGPGDYQPNRPGALSLSQTTGNSGHRIACGVIRESG